MIRWFWTLGFLVVSASHNATGAETTAFTGMAERTLTCAACHGKEGRATTAGFFPRIAGKPSGYLYSQLLNFRDGRRYNSLMSPLLTNLSDTYLREIAEYFASLDLPYPPPQNALLPPQVRTRGEELVRSGDTARNIPACTACHGLAMMGRQPAIPGLLGLPRDYLNAQLGAWRTGQRKAASPDCMHSVALLLDTADVSALSEWLATQPVPLLAKAAIASDSPLPAECGKVPK